YRVRPDPAVCDRRSPRRGRGARVRFGRLPPPPGAGARPEGGPRRGRGGRATGWSPCAGPQRRGAWRAAWGGGQPPRRPRWAVGAVRLTFGIETCRVTAIEACRARAEEAPAMFDSMKPALDAELARIRDAGLWKSERVLTSPQGPEVTLEDGRRVLVFCANNYLGLSSHPETLAAAPRALPGRGGRRRLPAEAGGDRRRLQHGWHDREPEGRRRGGRAAPRAGDDRRLPRDRLRRADRTRHARAARRPRPRGHHHRHAGK